VTVAEERVQRGLARAVLVNAGCANACTGEPGHRATLETTRGVALALGAGEVEVLPASTGVIGAVLPAEKILKKTGELVERLSPDGVDDFALAICTTDRWPKIAEATLPNGARVLGIGKGAGMIHPDVGPPQATMLVFLFTDAVVEKTALSQALFAAADRTFNAITVDGDTSTNDSVVALASGASGLPASADELRVALTEVCGSLARSMVRDGEGAEHVIEIKVTGLPNVEAARTIARTVATSLLVKTALFGRDANWGRLLAAAGRSGVRFDPGQARISIAGIEIVRDGLAIGGELEAEAQRRMTNEAYTVEFSLGSGPGTFSYYTSDLGHSYVDVNAGYRS
jgi:glutamate N-acetyltransferase/amino-acid N-acetyltransferase